jgi:hypothetical protein
MAGSLECGGRRLDVAVAVTGAAVVVASWSPPLPCGMGFAVWAGAVAGGAAGVVTAAWLGGALWCWDELPDGVAPALLNPTR